MKTTTMTLALSCVTLALAACNNADNDRTTSVPRTVNPTVAVQNAPTGMTAPAAPKDLSPPPPNANDAAPGTDAEAAMANQPKLKNSSEKITGSSAETQRVEVQAQDAAVRAPDTASADKAKQEVMDQAEKSVSTPSGTAQDTEANNPRQGTTKDQENTQMPKAGQANNHSSPSLEKDGGK